MPQFHKKQKHTSVPQIQYIGKYQDPFGEARGIAAGPAHRNDSGRALIIQEKAVEAPQFISQVCIQQHTAKHLVQEPNVVMQDKVVVEDNSSEKNRRPGEE